MKKILYSIFLVLTLMSTSFAQNSNFTTISKPVLCGPLNIILKGLADKDVDEKPVWIGKREDQKTDFYLFFNFNTSAFTLIESGIEIGCILGIGYKSNFYDPLKEKTVPSNFLLEK